MCHPPCCGWHCAGGGHRAQPWRNTGGRAAASVNTSLLFVQDGGSRGFWPASSCDESLSSRRCTESTGYAVPFKHSTVSVLILCHKIALLVIRICFRGRKAALETLGMCMGCIQGRSSAAVVHRTCSNPAAIRRNCRVPVGSRYEHVAASFAWQC